MLPKSERLKNNCKIKAGLINFRIENDEQEVRNLNEANKALKLQLAELVEKCE